MVLKGTPRASDKTTPRSGAICKGKTETNTGGHLHVSQSGPVDSRRLSSVLTGRALGDTGSAAAGHSAL